MLFAGMMLAAAILRLTGVSWDERRHLHPDERFFSMLEDGIQFPKSVAGYFDSAHSPLNPFNRNFQPVYGTFPIFLAKVVSAALLHRDGYDTTFLVGRVLSALFDLATIWITYLLARRFGSRLTASCAASLLAFCPLGIQLSHFWGSDSFLTTFSALALLGSVRIARGRTRWTVLAGTGAAIGLAAACKVTGLALFGPAGFAVLASALFTESGRRQKLRALLLAAGRGSIVLVAAFAAVRVTFPYGFAGLFRLDPRWIGALKELTNLTRGYGFPPQVQWAGRTPLFPFRNLVLWGAGIFFGIPAVIALVWAPMRAWKRRDDGIFLLWLHALIVFGYHATASTKNIRYFYPAYPALAVLAAVMLAAFAERERAPGLGRRAARALPAIAVAGTFLFGL
ncbi:MAG TPA: glycosyltransferase family 39 protein, partial [Thermoanaerobaculia bacterium]|nr:glycosyltransferase family 39 protein [Thermoanaerobaculia bacterium]